MLKKKAPTVFPVYLSKGLQHSLCYFAYQRNCCKNSSHLNALEKVTCSKSNQMHNSSSLLIQRMILVTFLYYNISLNEIIFSSIS